MAADVKAPRIVRETTNMEDAADALRARRLAKSSADHVEPDLIDNALADLEMARIFLDATGRYFDELNEWLCPKGCAPNRALQTEVHRGETLMLQADDRIGLAEGRLRTALDQAFAAKPVKVTPRDERDRAYRFNEAFIPYRDAWNHGLAKYLLNVPSPDVQDRQSSAAYHAFEEMMDPLYSAARDAAVGVLLTPAATTADLKLKQEIIDQQEMNCASDGELIGSIMAQLIADGVVLAGGAA